jgi:dipeptide/tripeptide permease
VLLAVARDQRGVIYLSSALLGVGIGLAYATLANLVVEAVDQRQTGEATGVNTIMRTIGGSLEAQIAATIVASHQIAGTRVPAASGYTTAFVVSAIAMAVAVLAAIAIPGRRPPRRERAAPDPAPA